jgi:hypothetical protein
VHWVHWVHWVHGVGYGGAVMARGASRMAGVAAQDRRVQDGVTGAFGRVTEMERPLAACALQECLGKLRRFLVAATGQRAVDNRPTAMRRGSAHTTDQDVTRRAATYIVQRLSELRDGLRLSHGLASLQHCLPHVVLAHKSGNPGPRHSLHAVTCGASHGCRYGGLGPSIGQLHCQQASVTCGDWQRILCKSRCL